MFFLLILNIPSVCADDYYADITIDIDDSGFVTIDGITNHPDLLVGDTEIYTSKKQILDLSLRSYPLILGLLVCLDNLAGPFLSW